MKEELNVQEELLNLAIEQIVMRAKKSSLQEKVINMSIVYDSIGVTWRNKDGSVFVMLFRTNRDPRTKDLATFQFATQNYSAEEYKNIQL